MATVTCHTPGCGNADVPIPDVPLTVTDPDTGQSAPAAVVCGVCGEQITDLGGG